MFELFEHTADLGLRVRAPDLESLFREAGEGFFSMIVESWSAAQATREFGFELEARRLDDLLGLADPVLLGLGLGDNAGALGAGRVD